MIDTHTHLNFPDFKKSLKTIIKRATKAGVKKIICVSSNLADSEKAVELAQKYPGIVYAAVGIHPQQTDPENKTSIEKQTNNLEKLANNKRVVAIGECGLDFSPAPPPEKNRTKEEQVCLFEKQIEIAQKQKLPLLVHSREAFDNTVDILKNYHVGGVFHCYSAGKKGIAKVVELGFYFGVDGNLTYDTGLQNVFAQIPLEKTLLETDAPFLSPVPHRSKKNEPAFLVFIAKKLAEIHRVSFKKIDAITTKNAFDLLDLDNHEGDSL